MMHFPAWHFRRLDKLREVHADTFRLCCRQVLPEEFNFQRCHAPSHVFSTCHSLLGTSYLRVLVSGTAALAVTGNAVSLVVRVLLKRGRLRSGLDTCLTHVSACDLVTGVVLAVLAIADWVYKGRYWQYGPMWTDSDLCQTVRVVSRTTSQASLLLFVLVTIHALHVRLARADMRHRELVFRWACLLTWCLAVALSISMMFVSSESYSRSSACFSLITELAELQEDHVMIGVAKGNGVLVSVCGSILVVVYLSRSYVETPLSDMTRVSDDVVMMQRLTLVLVFYALSRLTTAFILFIVPNCYDIETSVQFAMEFTFEITNAALNPLLYLHQLVAIEKRRRKRMNMISFLRTKRLIK